MSDEKLDRETRSLREAAREAPLPGAAGGTPGGHPGEGVPPEDPFASSANATVMAHFYRGEMNRLTIWRTRMDVTTNWAIIATVGLLTFSFRNPLADGIFLVNIAMLWFLLTVESRRYRFYDVWRWRLRILEAHFLSPILMEKSRRLTGPWREDLIAELLYPTFKISMREAMGRRLLRNYVYLFSIVLIAGLAEIFGVSLSTSSWAMLTTEHFTSSMREHLLLLILILVTYIPLLWLVYYGWQRRKVAVELHDPAGRARYRV